MYKHNKPTALEIINLFPVFCYSFNFEVSVLPVYTSFKHIDNVGWLGVKTCAYTLLIAVGYYLILVTVPVLTIPPYDNVENYKQTILTIIYFRFPKYIAQLLF